MPPVPARVGVLALQGAFAAHARVLAELGASIVEVRTPGQLDAVDALVMPGGESTTMSMLLESSGLFDPIAKRLDAGMPVLGTCAGMILLAAEVLDGRPDQRSFGAIDLTVRRNAYGRQVDSFETDLDVPDLDGPDLDGPDLDGPDLDGPDLDGPELDSPELDSPELESPPREAVAFHAVFIRAPWVERVGDAVDVLARYEGHAVLARQGSVTVASFHPELSGDPRIHARFLQEVP